MVFQGSMYTSHTKQCEERKVEKKAANTSLGAINDLACKCAGSRAVIASLLALECT